MCSKGAVAWPRPARSVRAACPALAVVSGAQVRHSESPLRARGMSPRASGGDRLPLVTALSSEQEEAGQQRSKGQNSNEKLTTEASGGGALTGRIAGIGTVVASGRPSKFFVFGQREEKTCRNAYTTPSPAATSFRARLSCALKLIWPTSSGLTQAASDIRTFIPRSPPRLG